MYQKLIFCDCTGEAISKTIKEQVLNYIPGLNTEICRLKDLCGLCASEKDLVKDLFTSDGEILVLACHSRAVKLILGYAGIQKFDKISFLNLRQSEAEKALNMFEFAEIQHNENLSTVEISSKPDWPAWYPVLDYSRCTACGQCADFCLFGVYQKNNGIVEVINPEACKINCPACARICPQIAIVFPKYVHGGAISGSDNYNELEEQKRQLEDMDKFLGEDIYQALERRKNKRKSIINADALKKANEERDKALKDNIS
jgi:Pyruvate/2-oxoacid:ferredoxin oxidoreductase delta subunit